MTEVWNSAIREEQDAFLNGAAGQSLKAMVQDVPSAERDSGTAEGKRRAHRGGRS